MGGLAKIAKTEWGLGEGFQKWVVLVKTGNMITRDWEHNIWVIPLAIHP